jgi:AcrR family transcriptional regulator
MPKVVDAASRRALFVEASWTLIANEGLNAATLRRVSAEAGFTMGALMHYFDDREALLVAALRAAHFAAGARMLEAAAVAESLRDRLRSVLLQALPLDDVRLKEWRVWMAFWGEAMTQSVFMDENTRRYDEWIGLLDVILPERLMFEPLQSMAIAARIDGFGVQITLAHRQPLRLATLRREAIADVERIVHQVEGVK